MRKIDLLLGMLLGFLATFVGVFLFFTFFTDYHFVDGIQGMKAQGYLGKVITLGAIMNLAVFFLLLKMNKELMARGVVLATLILTVVTLVV